ncbi:hypothetical protein ANN_24264 [Periplaneta americana]|uniref:Uncharacterized protein n=1 Tax=Periplaneta americana TaxID=6978 RepID=A0ABQ8S2M8_PERAM|nr:hypothetical protein ANN_24264 [Periplaneta americana]
MAAVSNGRSVMDPQVATQNAVVDRLKLLHPMVNEEETPLPRSWSPKDKYNYIGLSQNNLRVHYKDYFQYLLYRVLVGRSEGKRPLGSLRCRWEDNIKMDLREVGYDDREWINLAQDRDRWRAYVRATMNLQVP